jgi:hypothetical protein
LVGLIACIAQSALSQTSAVNIVSYDIDAKIPPRADVIELTVTCGMQKTDTSLQTQLLLSSSSKVQNIRAWANGGWSEIPFEFVGQDTLQLRFPKTLRQAGPLSMEFKYAFPIGSLGDSLLLLDRGSRWYPLISDQIAKLKLKCEVPSGYTVLSAGDLIETKPTEGGARFVWETQLPIFKLPLVVFKSSSLKKNSSEVLNKKIVLYSSAGDSLPIDSILAEAKNAFAFFTDAIGDYPDERLTLVQVPYFEGIDISSGLLMVGSSSFHEMGKGDFDALHLAVAEQWIGAGVFAKFREPGFWFMTISMPHYLRLMYIRHSKGEAAFDDALHEPMKRYEQFAGKETDVPIIDVDFPNSKEKGLVLYGKGPFVIDKLRKQMGDEQWEMLLRDIYRNCLGKILTYDEFRSCVSKHDKSGNSLTLLNRLMTNKGIPEE